MVDAFTGGDGMMFAGNVGRNTDLSVCKEGHIVVMCLCWPVSCLPPSSLLIVFFKLSLHLFKFPFLR